MRGDEKMEQVKNAKMGEEGFKAVVVEKYGRNIRNAIKFIEENYMEELLLEDMCMYAMISRTYFCIAFKEITGMTFSKFVVHVRIERAKEFLKNTDLQIGAICHRVGFNEVSHFCRTFKKLTGISAKEYRADNRKRDT